MFNIDLSDVSFTGCTTIQDENTIYNYNGSVRTTYTLYGNKFYKTAENEYSRLPTQAVCQPANLQLQSSQDMGFFTISAVLIVLAFFYVVLHWFYFRGKE